MYRENILNVDGLKHDCTGCGACFIVCPSKAIRYELNKDGFYSVKVNSDKCIKCKKCLKVCSKNLDKEKINNIYGKKVCAAYSRDKMVLGYSTSGGIAYELSRNCLSKEWLVFGTELDICNDNCKIIKISEEAELKRIQGSKYLQSSTIQGFEEAIEIAKNEPNRNFLVFGTPCQIYGLSKVLEMEKLRERFLLVEVFCHGVPSRLLWNKYLQEFKQKKHITTKDIKEIAFRNKKYGWHMYTIKIGTKNGEHYITSDASNFYKMYFDHVVLNKACSSCLFREGYSSADIRLGDFWGNEFIKNEDGISAVILLTAKGKDVWDTMKNQIEILGQYNSEMCIKYQSTQKYRMDKEMNNKVLKQLMQEETSLKTIIKSYRKSLGIKERIRLKGKDILATFPPNLKVSFKRYYNFMRNGLRR